MALAATCVTASPVTNGGQATIAIPGTGLAATLVTLHASQQPADEVFQQFAAAAHVRFTTGQPNEWKSLGRKRVSLSCDQMPFLQALGELCMAAGVFPANCDGTTVDLIDDHRGWSAEPSLDYGPFEVHAAKFESDVKLLLGREITRNASSMVTLVMMSEPGVRAVYLDDVQNLELRDSDGKAIKAQFKAPFAKPMFGRGHCWTSILVDPPADATQIKLFKGDFIVVVVNETSPLLLPWNVGTTARDAGSLKMNITTRAMPGGNFEVSAIVEDTARDAAQWEQIKRAFSLQQPVLSDASGREYVVRSSGGGPQSEWKYRCSYTFNVDPRRGALRPGAPVKINWDVPKRCQAVTIPVEFKDLPLP
jgi:hypothetical protein